MAQVETDDLVAQAGWALESLRYREAAALYHAAAVELQVVLRDAEGGNRVPLEAWLKRNSHLLHQQSLGASLLERVSIPMEASRQLDFEAHQHSSIPASDFTAGPLLSYPTEQRSIARDSQASCSAESQDFVGGATESCSPWSDLERIATDRLKGGVGKSPENPISELESAPLLDSMRPFDDGSIEAEKKSIIPVTQRKAQSLIEQEPAKETLATEGVSCESATSADLKISSREGEKRKEAKVAEHRPVEGEGRFSIESLQSVGRPKERGWRRFFSPAVLGSVVVHGIALLILSFVVIRQIQKAERLSIVAATVEAENVLLETPLEAPDAMQVDELQEPTMELPATDAIVSDVSLPSLVAPDTSGPQVSDKSTSDSVSKAVQAIHVSTGANKIAPGAEFFGVKATGNTFIYIVDCSPSMRRDGAFEAARQEIARSLQSMTPKQRFYIYFFGKEVERMELNLGSPEDFPVYATQENVQKTHRWLSRASVQKEGLPPNDVLREAIEMQPDGIFLLFDGDTRTDVAKHLGQVNRTTDILNGSEPKVPIHVVHFFLEDFAPSMKRVAAENLGTYRFIPRPKRDANFKR